MAKLIGPIKFVGTLGGITGVNSREGHYVKQKKEISRERYLTGPEYEDFRINGIQMRAASDQRKNFISGLRHFEEGATNTRMYSRLNGAMKRIIKADNISRRDRLAAHIGILTPKGKDQLMGFEFNKFTPLSRAFGSLLTTNYDDGSITIKPFIPESALGAPGSATHAVLESAMFRYNFENMESTLVKSQTFTIKVTSEEPVETTLTHGIPPGEGGTLFMLLKMRFYMEYNNIFYPLRGRKSGMMQIVGIEQAST